MATTIYHFTTPDEVRAVLGVTPEDLEDKTVELPIYLRQLQFEFTDIDSTLESSYLTIVDIDESTRTTAQQKLFDVMQVFSTYAVSFKLVTSAPVFAPRRVTDGRAEAERVTDPFATLKQDVEANYTNMRIRLRDALAALGTTVAAATSRCYFAAAGLATNPVTNA